MLCAKEEETILVILQAFLRPGAQDRLQGHYRNAQKGAAGEWDF